MKKLLLAVISLAAVSGFTITPPAQGQSNQLAQQVAPRQRTLPPDILQTPPAPQQTLPTQNMPPNRRPNAESRAKPTGEMPVIDLGEVWRRLLALEKTVKELQNEQSKLLAKATFSCKTDSISVNGAGVQQNCFPYLCHPIDGRCALQTCESVNDCAPPTVCNSENRCVTMPRQ